MNKYSAWYARLNREQQQSLGFGIGWPLGGVLFAFIVGVSNGNWEGAWKGACCFFFLGLLFFITLTGSLYNENRRVRDLKKIQRLRAKLDAERVKQERLDAALAVENERLTTARERAKLNLKHSD